MHEDLVLGRKLDCEKEYELENSLVKQVVFYFRKTFYSFQ